jgi:geranylgeranyl diphosphate synthase type I
VELMHNFSLIHDDIQDAGVKRRHRATVWVVWGKEQAINAGDAMHALSQLAVLRLEGVSEEKVLHLARLLDEACLRLCQGQNMDMAFEDHLDVDVNAYLKMIADKTASLFEWAAHAGALLGTGDEVTVEHLAHFGRNLGIVYQIRDDILGIWGEEEATGKSPASDILSKKKTLPVILGLERMGRGGELFQIYRKESLEPQDIPRVVEILDQLGVREEADEMAKRYHAEALSQLKVSRLAPHARGGLEEMASLILKG